MNAPAIRGINHFDDSNHVNDASTDMRYAIIAATANNIAAEVLRKCAALPNFN